MEDVKKLGLSVENKELKRGEAFNFIWDAVTKPICSDGAVLAVKLGKMAQEDIDNVAVKNDSGTEESVAEESGVPENKDADTDDSVLKKIEIKQFGYTVLKADEWITVNYALELCNSNKKYAVSFPKIYVTVRDNDGKILKTEDQALWGIAADDSYMYAGDISYKGIEPETVEISVQTQEDRFELQADSDMIKSDNLVIANTSKQDGYSISFTGEITNNSKEDLSRVKVVVVYKKGDKIVGGDIEYMDDLLSGQTLPFEISYCEEMEYDSYEITAFGYK